MHTECARRYCMKLRTIDDLQVCDMIMPDNWHVHLREINHFPWTACYSAQQFGRVLAMPNTKKPLKTVEDVLVYKHAAQIIGQKNNPYFTLIVPLYLTGDTTLDIIRAAYNAGIHVAKLYPFGATTQSQHGVKFLRELYPLFSLMQALDMVLSMHCEVTDVSVDFFDRERIFIDRYLLDLVMQFPNLRIIIEHVSTREAVQFVMGASEYVGATITPQHLLCNRNDLFSAGMMPSRFCFPVINSADDQCAVQSAVKHRRFFAGTDSAPHPIDAKLADGASGGCFTEPCAMALYAHALECLDVFDYLEEFTSIRGANFYGYPLNTAKIRLIRDLSVIQKSMCIDSGVDSLLFMHDEKINWKFDCIIN